MNKLKILAACVVFMFSMLSVSFSGHAEEKKPHPLKIGISFQTLNNSYLVLMKKSLEEAAAEIGAQVLVTDARNNVSKQVNDIEDMLQENIDILLLNPADSVGVQSAVMDAKEKGVVVVAVDAQASGPVDSYVGSKNYDAGYMAGKYLAEQLGGKGDVAILDGIPVVPILERVKGFEAAIKEHPEMKIVTRQNGHQDRATALNVTENILQSAPTLKGLFSVNDAGALGAIAAIDASGKDVKMVSVDGYPEAVDIIAKGNPHFIATSGQFPRDQLRIALGMALARHWGAKIPATVPVDVKLVTKENAKDFHW